MKCIKVCLFFLGMMALVFSSSGFAKAPAKSAERKFLSKNGPIEALQTMDISFLPESLIQLNGDSTLRKYSSTAKVLDLTGLAVVKPVPEVTLPWTPSEVKMVLAVENLKSGESTLDDHMYENLKFDKHPEITLRLLSFTFSKVEDKSQVTASGTLTVAGVSRSIELTAILKIEGEKIKISGSKKVRMSDYGITPPTMMLGALKTANEVEISFNLYCLINTKEKG